MGYKIAIDGTCASGKTEASKRVAKELNFVAVDTGAIYRALALKCMLNNVDETNEEEVVKITNNSKVDLVDDFVYLDKKDVSDLIRTKEVSNVTSIIATYGAVRDHVTDIQRDIASMRNVVMQGRDITSVVLPDAQVKIYLDASIEERTRRRKRDLEMQGEVISYDDVKKMLEERDTRDMTRKISPLVKTEDAVLIDSTNLSLEEVVNKIIGIAKERGLSLE